MNYYERVAKTVGLTLLLVTLVGSAVALLVIATDAFILIFLAILFAVLLAHTAAYLQRWLPLGYSWNLAIILLLLLSVTLASGFLSGSAIRQEVQRASKQLDQAGAKLEQWLQRNPTARELILGVPLLGRTVAELTGTPEQQSAEQKPGATTGRSSSETKEEGTEGTGQTAENNAADPDAADNNSAEAEGTEAGAESPENAAADEATSQTSSSETAANSPQERSLEDGKKTDGASSRPGQAFSALSRIFTTTFGALTSLAIIIFVGIFLAVDPQLYTKGLLGLFPQTRQARAAQILYRLDHVLFHWLIGRILTMLITGVGTGLGLWSLGVPLAGTVGAVTALLTFIPNLGGVLALLLAVLVALSQGPTTVMWVIGLYMLLQLVESNVITPLIQQHQTSVPPALLIAFQVLVGMLTGFLGLLIATPLLASLMVIVDEFWYTEPNDVL